MRREAALCGSPYSFRGPFHGFFQAAGRLRVQLAQVVHGSVEQPLAAAAVEPAHAEPASTLAVILPNFWTVPKQVIGNGPN